MIRYLGTLTALIVLVLGSPESQAQWSNSSSSSNFRSRSVERSRSVQVAQPVRVQIREVKPSEVFVKTVDVPVIRRELVEVEREVPVTRIEKVRVQEERSVVDTQRREVLVQESAKVKSSSYNSYQSNQRRGLLSRLRGGRGG